MYKQRVTFRKIISSTKIIELKIKQTTIQIQLKMRKPRGTREVMYVKRKIEVRSYNHCCSRKAISITYSECVSVTLCIQHAMCVRHIVLSSVA
jgi:hypothetical protein